MSKQHPAIIGFLQALGLTVYITILALTVNTIAQSGWDPNIPQIVRMMLFLMVFVFSALVSSTIMLWYAATLILKNKYRAALEVVGWSAGWLFIIGCVVLGIIVVNAS